MLDDRRPDPGLPGSLEQSGEPARGRLKIFFGYAAGVGKTYAMLEAARRAKEAGVDVVAGYIEPHTRPETMALLNGLEQLPVKHIPYKGIELREFDLDAALERNPQLILVDELAHTNVEGCRHAKRWQDVMELLEAGSNVISAGNIQHIESLNEEVRKMVGVDVKERIPDSVLREADEVVNIDLTAEELVERLKAGKIYAKEKIQTALDNFFNPGNILQLRELALREVAFRVGKKVDYEVKHREQGVKGVARLVVCVSSNNETQQHIIRKAARMADTYNAELIALYVQTANEDNDSIPLDTQRHLMGHLQLVVELGGRVHKVVSDNIALTLSPLHI